MAARKRRDRKRNIKMWRVEEIQIEMEIELEMEKELEIEIDKMR